MDRKKVNAKSIMSIISLAVSKGTEITIIADGRYLLLKIVDLVTSGLVNNL